MKTNKINNIIISLFLFHISFTQIFSNYIILPFNTEKVNSSLFTSETNYYTLLSIGQPEKTVEMYIKFNRYNFFLGKGLCRSNSFSNYIPNESKTFENYSDYEYKIDQIENATNATDDFFFYANDLDLKNNITILDMQFFYGDNYIESEIVDKEKICGIIGFNIYFKDMKYKDNFFMNILKQNNIISSYTFSFIFSNKNNKYNNYFIIGMNEEEISKIFNSNDLRTIKVRQLVVNQDWRIPIDEFFLSNNLINETNTKKKLMSSDTMASFDNQYDFIIIQQSDFDFIDNYFFRVYINEKKCQLNSDTLYGYKVYFITCDKNFKDEMKKFPNINFMVRDINYTFTLTYEDLFIEFNQKIYFMVVKEYNHRSYSTFGNIFLKKFPLVFDYDKKTVTFIKINNTSNNEKISESRINFYLFFICGICIVSGISFGIIIGKNICNKNKKKRANELADDYDYNINENNNEERLNESGNEINS